MNTACPSIRDNRGQEGFARRCGWSLTIVHSARRRMQRESRIYHFCATSHRYRKCWRYAQVEKLSKAALSCFAHGRCVGESTSQLHREDFSRARSPLRHSQEFPNTREINCTSCAPSWEPVQAINPGQWAQLFKSVHSGSFLPSR